MAHVHRKHRPSHGHITVRVGWTHPETDEDFDVECDVGPDEPEIRWGDNACPGSPGEIEILAVADMKGHDRPDLLELVQEDFDTVCDRAAEAAADEANDRAAADADYAYDRMKEGW